MARGIVRLWTDNLAGARADLSLAIEKVQVGEPLRVSQAVAFRGEAAFRMGLLDEAVEQGELAVALATEAERAWEFPMLHGLAALPRVARGEFAEAENHLAVAAHWAGVMGTPSAVAHASAARALLALARDDPEALLAAAVDFTDVCDLCEPGSHVLGPVLAEALTALGRLDEAASALDDFEVMVRASGRRSARASSARVGGQLAAAVGDWDRAESLFSEAVSTAEELAMPLSSGLAHLAWGNAAVRSGKRRVAARELQAARKVFKSCGAAAFAQLADRSLEKMGFSRAGGREPGPRGSDPHGGRGGALGHVRVVERRDRQATGRKHKDRRVPPDSHLRQVRHFVPRANWPCGFWLRKKTSKPLGFC